MRPRIRITKEPIKPDAVLRDVRTPEAGGTVSFIGTVRRESDGLRVTGIELEAATDLAKADVTRIAVQAMERFGASRISVIHRIGRLPVGEVIVAIAVSAPHRADAFSACRYVIDELKKTTPIWKKEFSGRKSRWVEGGR